MNGFGTTEASRSPHGVIVMSRVLRRGQHRVADVLLQTRRVNRGRDVAHGLADSPDLPLGFVELDENIGGRLEETAPWDALYLHRSSGQKT